MTKLESEDLFELSHDIIGLFSSEGALLCLSPHWRSLDVVEHIHELLEPPHYSQLDEALAQVRRTGRAELIAPFLTGAMQLQWRLQAAGDGNLHLALSPVYPDSTTGNAMADGVAVGLALLDEEGRLRYVNKAYIEQSGYSREQVLGLMFTDMLRPEDRPIALERHRLLVEEGIEPDRVEYEVGNNSGERRIIEVRSSQLVLPQGVFRLVTIIDITEVRQHEYQSLESDLRYLTIFENTSEGIYHSTPDGRLTEANGAMVRMHQCRSKEELIASARDLTTDWYIDPNVRMRLIEMLDQDDQVENFEAEVYCLGTGERFWTSESASAIRNANGELLYYQGTVRNITDERRRRELAANRIEILEMIARGGDLTDILYELVGAIERYRPRATAAICRLSDGLLYVQAAPGLSNNCIKAMHQCAPSRIGGPIAAAIRTHRSVIDFELEDCEQVSGDLANAMSEIGYSNVMAQPVLNQAGAVLGVLMVFVSEEIDAAGDLGGILREVAQIASVAYERQGLADRLLQQAQYDPLTQLPNRTLLDDRLNQLMLEAERNEYPIGVMMLDLDEFKLVNDTLGHPAGDKLLQQVAARLQDCLRSGDTVARFGGDEFVIVIPLRETVRASDVAERILDALQSAFPIDGRELHARPSIGISLYPQDGLSPKGLVQAADTAMYAAKTAGKNRYRFFSESMNAEVSKRLRIEGELSEALREEQLILHYQPVVACDDERIVGAEALLRWNHPEHGLLLPGSFLPVAEQSALISEIDYYVLETATRQIAQWRKSGHELLMSLIITSLNLSARGLHEEGFAFRVARVLKEASVDPACVELEITESMVMHDFAGAVAQLRDLKERAPGLRIAIDDFGTGHASFAYLQQLPVDTLKIDMTFIADLEKPESAKTARAIIKAMVELGRNLDLTVVAEGVETRAQADYLRSIGCHRAQGFLFSHALDPENFHKFVKA